MPSPPPPVPPPPQGWRQFCHAIAAWVGDRQAGRVGGTILFGESLCTKYCFKIYYSEHVYMFTTMPSFVCRSFVLAGSSAGRGGGCNLKDIPKRCPKIPECQKISGCQVKTPVTKENKCLKIRNSPKLQKLKHFIAKFMGDRM